MHSLKNSLAKRWHALRLDNARCARVWQGQYWRDEQGTQVIHCRDCRKFDAGANRCRIAFGSPIRKCVTAAQEANLHSLGASDVLEVGFGRHSLPRTLVTGAGGRWTGIEPMAARSQRAALGRGGFGHVADIPFADSTFDVVLGIQTLEHWDEALPDPDLEVGYDKAFREIHRVLKPGGRIYFDAPIHLHGHEMFVTGDLARIRALFDPALWRDVSLQKWREEYAPLERYPAPPLDVRTWPATSTYAPSLFDEIREERSVYLVVVNARKA